MSHLALPRPSNHRTISPTSTSTSSSTSSRITSQSLKSHFTTPRKNKPYLYVALYPRGNTTTSFHSSCNCDTHHWALLISPRTALRSDPGTRYHLSHSTLPSSYEESDIQTSSPASAILIRVAIAKVRSQTALETVLRGIPVTSSQDSYTCLSFVRDAFVALHAKENKRVCLKSYLKDGGWQDIEACARMYCKRKRDMGRLVGVGARFANGVVGEQEQEQDGDEDELDPDLHAANGHTEAVNGHPRTQTDAQAVNAHVNGQPVNEDPRVDLHTGIEDETTPAPPTQLHTEQDTIGPHEQGGHDAGRPSQTEIQDETQTQTQIQTQTENQTVTQDNISEAPPQRPPARRRTNRAGVICTYNFWENREVMS